MLKSTCCLTCSAGIVRVEQKNNTLLEMGVYDDGPYEVGDENLLNPELVPVPANSYLGECLPLKQIHLFLCVNHNDISFVVSRGTTNLASYFFILILRLEFIIEVKSF